MTNARAGGEGELCQTRMPLRQCQMDRDNNTKTRTGNHPQTKGKTQKRYLTPLIMLGPKSLVSTAIVAVLVAVGAGLIVRNCRREPVSADSGFRVVMGTFAHIIAVADDGRTARAAIERAMARITAVDEMMSNYKPDSQLSEVNRDAYRGPVRVDDELFKVISTSLEYSRETGGAFDVTIGPVTALWRKAAGEERRPTERELAEAKARVGYDKLQVDPQNRTIRFSVDGMLLDLGGIAKGYAIDMAVEAMRSAGARGGMVDIGGDLRCFGTPPKNKPHWTIGLQDPTDEEAGQSVLLKLKLSDSAIATSGDYRRFVVIDGQRQSHIMDPRAGNSARGLSSVTVITPYAIDADALATSVTVMGAKKGMEFIEMIDTAEAILIDDKQNIDMEMTTGAAAYIVK